MILRAFLAITLTMFLVSCASGFDPKPYAHAPIGKKHPSVEGTIVSAVDRTIDGSSAEGAAAGATIGTGLGLSAGNSYGENATGAIAGAVLVGLVGALIEKNATKIDITDFLVRTVNGNEIRILHARTADFRVGDKVALTYGSPITMNKLP